MDIKELEARIKSGVSIVHLSASADKRVTSGLSTGSLLMNDALSGTPNVGYAWGRIVELYGPEMSGKTTLALHAVAEAQKLDYPCMYIDAEHGCDPYYMKAIGVDLDKLSFVQPDYGEQSLETVIQAVKEGYKLVVIDSVAALTPLAELEGNMGDAHIGRQARMMGQGLRKMTSIVAKNKAIVIFINQLRMKIGVMFGNPETTPGGKALKFFASYRVDVRSPRGGKIEEKDLMKKTHETGIKTNIKIAKNKLYPPFRTATFRITYGRGIDKAYDVIDYLKYKGKFGESGLGSIILVGHKYKVKQAVLILKKSAFARKQVKIMIKEIAHGSNRGSASRQGSGHDTKKRTAIKDLRFEGKNKRSD